MAYPRRLLNEGEEVALDLKPHWWYFSKHIVTGVPLVFVLVLLIGLSGWPRRVMLWLWAFVAVVWAVWLGLQYAKWHFTQFVVTNRRVVYRTGVVRKEGVEIPLTRISNINFDQNLWERLIGAGDLVIESAGREGRTRFDDVQHPDGVQQELYRQMELHERERAGWGSTAAPAPPPAPVPAAPQMDVTEQIGRLAELRDQGAITEAEFQAKKAELLRRL